MSYWKRSSALDCSPAAEPASPPTATAAGSRAQLERWSTTFRSSQRIRHNNERCATCLLQHVAAPRLDERGKQEGGAENTDHQQAVGGVDRVGRPGKNALPHVSQSLGECVEVGRQLIDVVVPPPGNEVVERKEPDRHHHRQR